MEYPGYRKFGNWSQEGEGSWRMKNLEWGGDPGALLDHPFPSCWISQDLSDTRIPSTRIPFWYPRDPDWIQQDPGGTGDPGMRENLAGSSRILVDQGIHLSG